jgi:glycosyltransferase involved in cell wall biosynthesis
VSPFQPVREAILTADAHIPGLMFITGRLEDRPFSARTLLSCLHYQGLQDIYGDRLVLHELDRFPVTGMAKIRALRHGFIDGVSHVAESQILARLRDESVTRVFLNGSNLGRLARAIKLAAPSVEVLTFFHNVEARYFLGWLKANRSLHALGVLAANCAAERMAVRFSDRLITLSSRDSGLLGHLYGRGATDLLPMAVRDHGQDRATKPATASGMPYLLFVGGNSYANAAGIGWFVKQVAPHIGLRICIVGQGSEAWRAQFGRGGDVECIGEVVSLAPWYHDARAVIAPIFEGSGMKTKVAEALMFGKRVIGTPEAFSGYEAIAAEAGWDCRTPEEFIARIRQVEEVPPPAFDPNLRALYERDHAFQPLVTRLRGIMGRW